MTPFLLISLLNSFIFRPSLCKPTSKSLNRNYLHTAANIALINIRQLIRVAYEQVLVVAVVQITHFPSVEFYSIDKCSVWIEYKYFFINKISNLGCTSCTTVTHE